MTPNVRRMLAALGLLLFLAMLQSTIVPLIAISGAIPSLLLIGTVFVSLREGQMTAMIASFPAGILVDAYSSGLVGITALGLVVTAFAAGFFHDEEKASMLVRSPQAVAIMLPASLLFHTIYVFSYFQTLDIHFLPLFLRYVLGASLYTTVLSVIPVLIIARRRARLKV
ncbi:MAG: rod shape-determining protein MreD [Bacteroidetes bacterium]|nr:rod shape-determining protein MreD [Bacteroidota bacterium]